MKTIELVRLLLAKPKDEIALAMFILKDDPAVPINREKSTEEERIINIFAEEGMVIRTGSGRPKGSTNANSKLGKVRAEVNALLSSGKPVRMSLSWESIAAKTGIPINQVRTSAYAVKGIIHENGLWSFAPSTKAA